MKKAVIFIFMAISVLSCMKVPDIPDVPIANFTIGGGVLLANEGNFRNGNGSLSFFSYDSLKIFNDLFTSVNKRPLGDVPNSINVKEDKIYIIVNNSGKIEIVNHASCESMATISGLISPRNMAVINDNKAYVTSLYSDSLAIIDLPGNTVAGYINLRRSSESLELLGNEAFIANWAGGNEVMVVNTINDMVVDSIQVGMEPESMAIDNKKRLWVLCNGGWARQSAAELVVINMATHKVEKKFTFSTKTASPTCLQIDGVGQTLYFIDKGVKIMDINSVNLPVAPIVPEETGSSFYKIAVNPINSDIFISDAGNYAQPGYLLLYKNDGNFISRNKAGIIPGSMCFKLRINTQTK
jgi:DNA-binding beta-propeller fold protein YncE